MIDAGTSFDARRADEARAQLLGDIGKIKEMGGKMIDRTETAIHKAPLVLGLGLGVGVALIAVAVIAGRRPRPSLFPRAARERSFFAEAVRSAALSALGILSGRVTQHLLAAAAPDPEKLA